jgi:uncharacterized protein (TIGR02453 family)
MQNSLNLAPALQFLSDLGQNNHKAWFDEHRPEYDAARDAFAQWIDGLIAEFRTADGLGDLTARECVGRIYRDIRFSRDKSPYKTNLAALVGPGGWKGSPLGYYIAIDPHDRSMVAGGLYDPTPEQLGRFRQQIARDASEYKALTSAPDFIAAFGAVEGERLKTAPQGYDRTHPEIATLQLKQITAVQRFSDREVAAEDYPDRAIAACRAMRPFLAYLSALVYL